MLHGVYVYIKQKKAFKSPKYIYQNRIVKDNIEKKIMWEELFVRLTFFSKVWLQLDSKESNHCPKLSE